jgi:hypothetical protein
MLRQESLRSALGAQPGHLIGAVFRRLASASIASKRCEVSKWWTRAPTARAQFPPLASDRNIVLAFMTSRQPEEPRATVHASDELFSTHPNFN